MKRKEIDDLCLADSESPRNEKKPRVSDTSTIKTTSPYRSQATQTFEHLGYSKDGYPLKTRYLRRSSFAQAESRVEDWAESLPDEFEEMSNKSAKRRRGSDETSNSTSSVTEFSSPETCFEQHGIMLKETNKLNEEYQKECREYLEGDLKPGACLIYQEEELGEIIDDTESRLEAYVQRDILPWTVPSIINLLRTKEWNNNSIKEQMHSLWKVEDRMGHTQPKPDYIAGHSISSLTKEEFEACTKFHTSGIPQANQGFLLINQGFLLPFLICEAKSGAKGLLTAQYQNTHAGSIVVRAMFRLYQAAYPDTPEKLESINEKILVWSVDLNHENVNIYGHYGKLEDSLKIYRHRLAKIQLHDEDKRFIPYNFVRNVYDRFATEHLRRIKDALNQLRTNPSTESQGVPRIPFQPDRSSNEGSESLAGLTMIKQQNAVMMQMMQTMQETHNATQETHKAEVQTLKKVIDLLRDQIAQIRTNT